MSAPTGKDGLFLHEEILLLALRDRSGTVPLVASTYPNALATALLAELYLQGSIELDYSDQSDLVTFVSHPTTGSHLIGDVSRKIRSCKRRTSAERWVVRLSAMPDLKRRVAMGLVKRGILKKETIRLLFAFKRDTYPEVDHAPEAALIERLRDAIFTDTQLVATRTSALIAIAAKAHLLNVPFTKKALRPRRKRIAALSSGACGDATPDVMHDIATLAAAGG